MNKTHSNLIEIAAPIQIIAMPQMKNIKLNNSSKYFNTFAILVSPMILWIFDHSLAYYYIFSVFSKIRRWSSNENEHIKRNIVSMPRGYSRFRPVQWSNGGIIVLPYFHSNKFNQSDATLRNSTLASNPYKQKWHLI